MLGDFRQRHPRFQGENLSHNLKLLERLEHRIFGSNHHRTSSLRKVASANTPFACE